MVNLVIVAVLAVMIAIGAASCVKHLKIHVCKRVCTKGSSCIFLCFRNVLSC